jgi:hypothetical protein
MKRERRGGEHSVKYGKRKGKQCSARTMMRASIHQRGRMSYAAGRTRRRFALFAVGSHTLPLGAVGIIAPPTKMAAGGFAPQTITVT